MAREANRALLKAANDGSLSGVNVALKAGADIDCDDLTGQSAITRTALFIAAYKGHVDIVKLLLRKGASLVKRTSVIAFSPLHTAAANGNTEVVEVLVHHGATLDIRNSSQMTPLMQACFNGHADTARRLIEFGARADLIIRDNVTALDVCEDRENGDTNKGECIKLLREALEKKQLRCCNPKCGKPGYRKSQSQNQSSILKLCGGCKLTRYCSRECQKHHWSVGHKKCCGHDGYSGPRPVPKRYEMKVIKRGTC